jgi:hypothetical protein
MGPKTPKTRTVKRKLQPENPVCTQPERASQALKTHNWEESRKKKKRTHEPAKAPRNASRVVQQPPTRWGRNLTGTEPVNGLNLEHLCDDKKYCEVLNKPRTAVLKNASVARDRAEVETRALVDVPGRQLSNKRKEELV